MKKMRHPLFSDDFVFRAATVALRQYQSLGQALVSEKDYRISAIEWLQLALERLEAKD